MPTFKGSYEVFNVNHQRTLGKDMDLVTRVLADVVLQVVIIAVSASYTHNGAQYGHPA